VLSEIVTSFFSADLNRPVEICYLYGPAQYGLDAVLQMIGLCVVPQLAWIYSPANLHGSASKGRPLGKGLGVGKLKTSTILSHACSPTWCRVLQNGMGRTRSSPFWGARSLAPYLVDSGLCLPAHHLKQCSQMNLGFLSESLVGKENPFANCPLILADPCLPDLPCRLLFTMLHSFTDGFETLHTLLLVPSGNALGYRLPAFVLVHAGRILSQHLLKERILIFRPDSLIAFVGILIGVATAGTATTLSGHLAWHFGER